MQDKILVVEDSTMIRILLHRALSGMDWEVLEAQTYADAQAMIESYGKQIFLALLDLNLPDAPNGEIVPLVKRAGIPIVIFTSTLSGEKREKILSMGIVDYIYKKNRNEIDYIRRLVKRVHRNRNIKVLVVDDSKTAREYICRLLEQQQLQTLNCSDPNEAMGILSREPAIKMVVVDFYMGEVDGPELVSRIRKYYARDQLAILGVSGSGAGELSVQLLKAGANDYLAKPFMEEEFNCRVMQNLEHIENIREIREAGMRDPLTRLYNRGFFYQAGRRIYDAAGKANRPMAVAMMDIDHFQPINDKYGTDRGDIILRQLARILDEAGTSQRLVARYGGQTFATIVTDIPYEDLHQLFDRIRNRVAITSFDSPAPTIRIQLSVGINCERSSSFQNMVSLADFQRHRAKEEGGNRVAIDIDDED